MEKKGSSLTNWVFGICIILLLIIVLQTTILNPMNEKYNKSFSIGLNTSSYDNLVALTGTGDNEIANATVEVSGDGLTAKSAWTIGKAIYSTLVNFINGNFFSQLGNMMDLPPIIAQSLTVLVWISLIMIIIYIFVKVIP